MAGEEIPLLARAMAIIDAFEVMIGGRIYKPAVSKKEALVELARYSGKQFDPYFAKLLSIGLKSNGGKRKCLSVTEGLLPQEN